MKSTNIPHLTNSSLEIPRKAMRISFVYRSWRLPLVPPISCPGSSAVPCPDYQTKMRPVLSVHADFLEPVFPKQVFLDPLPSAVVFVEARSALVCKVGVLPYLGNGFASVGAVVLRAASWLLRPVVARRPVVASRRYKFVFLDACLRVAASLRRIVALLVDVLPQFVSFLRHTSFPLLALSLLRAFVLLPLAFVLLPNAPNENN